jgi:dolichyl-diphosphooligosaccharide--protein glycosyltransferase
MRFRRVLVYLNAFPATAVHDYFQGFPQGTGVISPPTMEFLLAAFLRPLRSWPGLAPALRAAVAFLPPLCGAATVLVLGAFVRRWFGAVAGVVAALALALMPAHVDVTVLGRFDNEMLEPLLLLLLAAAYARTYAAPASISAWAKAGGAATAYLLVWRGALFPLAIVGADAARRVVVRIGSDEARVVARGAAAFAAVPAAVLLVVCGTNAWGTRDAFLFNVPSLFHLALFSWASVVALVASRLLPPDDRLTASRAAGLGGWLALALVGLALMGLQLRSGLTVLQGGDPWLDSIVQYERGSLREAPVQFGLLAVLTPAVLLWLTRPRFASATPRAFLIGWSIVMLVAAALRLRFAMYLALNVALLGGVGIAAIAERFAPRRALLASIVLLLLLQAPTYPDLLTFFRYGPTFSIRGDVEDTLLWLRDHTPRAGDPTRPTTPPAYGVLAPWDWGGWIETIAERPSVATSFGREAYGMEELSHFLLAPDPEVAAAVVAKNRVRYVVLASVFRSLATHARLLRDPVVYIQEIHRGKATGYLPTRAALALPSVRLFFADGRLAEIPGVTFAPVDGFRLAYESGGNEPVPDIPWDVKRVKVFEVVEGARVRVHAVPGAAVTVSQPIETNQGRTFPFESRKVSGADGTATFVLPYAPKAGTASTGSVGPVSVACGPRIASLTLTAEDVDARRTIEVRLSD